MNMAISSLGGRGPPLRKKAVDPCPRRNGRNGIHDYLVQHTTRATPFVRRTTAEDIIARERRALDETRENSQQASDPESSLWAGAARPGGSAHDALPRRRPPLLPSQRPAPCPLTRRSLLLGAAALAGCARVPAAPPGPRDPITLEAAFAGRSVGAGVFRVSLTGAERRFTARLDGRLEGDRLTVVEDFIYDDGEENRLTWVFDRAGPGRWTGRREDTVGTAEVVEAGTEVRLSYLADFRSGDGVTRLGFEDVIYFGPDGRIINDAIVTRWGLPVGRVRFEMVRI